jgi:hypothetical protein
MKKIILKINMEVRQNIAPLRAISDMYFMMLKILGYFFIKKLCIKKAICTSKRKKVA